MQTAYAMHEVFEASSDPASADCCDGEIAQAPPGGTGCLVWCGRCTAACQKYGNRSCGGDGSYGLDWLRCPDGKRYLYQWVSPADHEFDGTCLHLTAR
jgi:hypothetical protein